MSNKNTNQKKYSVKYNRQTENSQMTNELFFEEYADAVDFWRDRVNSESDFLTHIQGTATYELLKYVSREEGTYQLMRSLTLSSTNNF